MDSLRTTDTVRLTDLVEPPRWQRLQDHFSRVLGIPLRTVTPAHELLVNPSWPVGTDVERVVGLLRISEELAPLLPSQEPPRDVTSLTTDLGVTYAAVPVHATVDSIVAYVVVGPMMVGPREDEEAFRVRISARGLDAQALWSLLLSLKLYTFVGIRSALTLMEDVGSAIVQLSYQARQLESILPSVREVDQAVVASHVDRILRSLLETAVLMTKADGGSVMLLDPRTRLLRVNAAQGLSDAIVRQTHVRHGEGVAGLAMERRSILLLDRETADAELAARMKRPELASSLIAPLIPDFHQEPIGVLSLRTTNPVHRFTPEHIEVLRRLLDLTCMTLGKLQFALAQAPAAP